MEKVVFAKLTQQEQELLQKAKASSERYTNSSGTRYTGAAMMTSSGQIFTGASIRRTSASSNTCSERMAIDQAIFARENTYTKLALIGARKDGKKTELIFPCGLCRQIIFEFYPEAPEGSIVISNSDMTEIIRTDIHTLFPGPFKPSHFLGNS